MGRWVVYERIKGKKPTVLWIEFGEKVLYKVKLGSKMEKISPRWDCRIFVGSRRRSNGILVATKAGIVKVRSVRRIPFETVERGLCGLGQVGQMASLQGFGRRGC